MPPAARTGQEPRYTSREAAQVSGVSFFTVDYWYRSGFLRPAVAARGGRGRGRERLYSYADILRLRIARELRAQQVSFETLRSVVARLGRLGGRIEHCRFVLIGKTAQPLRSPRELPPLLARPRRRTAFVILLDLTEVAKITRSRERQVLAVRSGRWAKDAVSRLGSPVAV